MKPILRTYACASGTPDRNIGYLPILPAKDKRQIRFPRIDSAKAILAGLPESFLYCFVHGEPFSNVMLYPLQKGLNFIIVKTKCLRQFTRCHVWTIQKRERIAYAIISLSFYRNWT